MSQKAQTTLIWWFILSLSKLVGSPAERRLHQAAKITLNGWMCTFGDNLMMQNCNAGFRGMKNWKSKMGQKWDLYTSWCVGSLNEEVQMLIPNRKQTYGVQSLFKARRQHSSRLSPLSKERCTAHKCLCKLDFLAPYFISSLSPPPFAVKEAHSLCFV